MKFKWLKYNEFGGINKNNKSQKQTGKLGNTLNKECNECTTLPMNTGEA